MPAKIIDGVKIAEQVRAEVAVEVRELKDGKGVTPGLAAILVGDNPASAIYVRNKGRACQEVGIFAETYKLPEDTAEADLLDLIGKLNGDSRFHGILLQLPLPRQINEGRTINTIDPRKDIDGIHPVNMGRLLLGEPVYVPCTPSGVQQMLLRSGYSPEGKHAVVCGRSIIVGKPVAAILMQKKAGANATVTICHTGTKDLLSITRQADILIAAMGSPRCITADMVKDGVVVIDVGINRVPDPSTKTGYRLVGDVDFDAVKEKAAAISPVPGGVGPMTIAMLLVNTTKAARLASNA
ncbi:MAG: bifunctional methylenetetrahydrofolate dehydrogenase/methenyltetrahydrofolate cyclohydrolase FolD [Chloroflexi bacterium]|nr:bifunctional methylenetetrahydrofolate dehydrogenase/methenyltetrahydrofolate cyclohydrolase FolD [Chloroflexota bacterium]